MPLAAAVPVLGLAAAFGKFVWGSLPTIPDELVWFAPWDLYQSTRIAEARIQWGISAFVYVAACLATVSVALYVFDKPFREHASQYRRKFHFGALSIAFAVGIPIFIFTSGETRFSVLPHGFYSSAMVDLWQTASKYEALKVCGDALTCFGQEGAPSLALWRYDYFTVSILARSVSYMNILTTSTLFLYILAMCAVTYPDPVETPDRADLTEQYRKTTLLLYAGALWLTLGVVQTYALFRLAGAFVPTSAETAIVGLASKIATINGAVFTVLLIAIYAPVAFLLSARVRRLPPIEAVSKPVYRIGVTGRAAAAPREAAPQGVWQQLAAMFAVLGPILIGPVMDFLVG